MGTLDAKQFEQCSRVQSVDVSEWVPGDGETLAYVRALSAKILVELQDTYSAKDAKPLDAVAAWCVHCMCDEKAVPLYEPTDEAMTEMCNRPFRLLEAIAKVAMDVNGALAEQAEGNSLEPDDDSPSGSQENAASGTSTE